MLDTTLATEFIPGTNVRGEVTGANWTFLLPQLHLGHVICVGNPPAAGLVTLARRAEKVTICCTEAQQLDAIREQYHLDNVCTSNAVAELPRSSFDLAVIVEGMSALRDVHLLAALQQVLTPEGRIYVEFGGPIERLWNGKALANLTERFGSAKVFWLTPLSGEMHTAVPMHDDATIDYFVQHQLYSSSVDLRVVKRAAQSLLRGSGRGARTQPQHVQTPHGGSTAISTAQRVDVAAGGRKNKALLDLIGQVQRTLDGAERFVSRHRSLSQLTQRYGVLLSRTATPDLHPPPEYLCEIARRSAVDLSAYRWGLSARGEYSSRKVLFFLFDGPKQVPEYVVKMTRAAALNPRLENESRALQLLHEKGFGDRETLPQVAFFGHHKELTIVGETVVQGVPFERQTAASADCRYAHAAVDWLIELSAATADVHTATALQAAEGLEQLYQRFVEIYDVSNEHRAFLSAQIATVRQFQGEFPTVFQHGDPGTWNVMVTPSGRVGFLDWEAAETAGMPLWDLFYLMRAYGVLASRRSGTRDMTKGFAEQYLHDTPISAMLVDATRRACDRIGLVSLLVEPLFYTCWMHRSLKEATRLERSGLERGHYIQLLRACIDQRNTPALQRLFAV